MCARQAPRCGRQAYINNGAAGDVAYDQNGKYMCVYIYIYNKQR